MVRAIGEQFVLDNGSARAEVGALAAVLRELRVGGVRLTESVAADALPPHGCGIVLAPWPNRVRGARWSLDGAEQRLDVTDVARGAAIHGLLRNTVYRERARSADAVTLAATIVPQRGWPFLLDSWVTYRVEPDGLTVTHGAENLGDARAPWAVGAHPYFRVGEHAAEEVILGIAAESRAELDETLLPVAVHDVAGTGFDLRAGARVADLDLNTAFGALANRDARADVAWLEAPDGSRTTLWLDPAFRWIQAYTPRDFPTADGVRTAAALEPMSAPADALNSGADLAWLEPGERWEASWGVRFEAGPRL